MSCASITLYAGAVAPEQLVVTVVRDPDDGNPPNFTLCTGASLLVRADACSVKTWALDIVNATATTLKVRHLFAADDIPKPGLRRMQVVFTMPDGQHRAEPFEVTVIAAP